MSKLTTPLLLIIALSGATLSQGTLDGLDLSSGINGSAPNTAAKSLSPGDVLSFRMDDTGSGTTGQLIAVAVDLVPDAFPICIDLDGNAGTCELNLGSNLFFLIQPNLANPLNLTLPSGGFAASVPIPTNSSLFAGVADESVRLQAAATNPAAPLGVSITNFIDHHVSELTVAGPTSDDGAVEVDLGVGIPFYGTVYSSVFVNANGNLTFGGADTDFNATASEMLSNEPRIAPAWHHVSPNNGGSVDITISRTAGDTFASLDVAWVGVPGFNVADLNDFTTTLHANGDIDFDVMRVSDNGTTIVGVSPGGGLSAASELDLNAGGSTTGSSFEALFEEYDGSGCDDNPNFAAGLSGTFVYDGTDAYTLTTSYVPSEMIESLSPSSGSTSGGTNVLITGVFDPAGTYSVTFGSNASVAAFVVDACTMTVTTPSNGGGAETVDVSVTNENTLALVTLASAFTYTPPANQNVQLFGDDTSHQIALLQPLTFYGVTYNELYFNMNGNVTFGAGDTSFSPSIIDALSGPPRIMSAWDDLTSQFGGNVWFIESDQHHSLHWGNVRVAGTTNRVNVSTFVHKSNGRITMNTGVSSAYNGAPGTRRVIVGISPGGNLGGRDAYSLAGPTMVASAPYNAIFEELNGADGPWDIDGLTGTGFIPDAAGTTYTIN